MAEDSGDKKGFGYDFFIRLKTLGKKEAVRDIQDLTKINNARLKSELTQYRYLQDAAYQSGIGKKARRKTEATVYPGDVNEFRQQVTHSRSGMNADEAKAHSAMQQGLKKLADSIRKYWKEKKRLDQGWVASTRIMGRARLEKIKLSRTAKAMAPHFRVLTNAVSSFSQRLGRLPVLVGASIASFAAGVLSMRTFKKGMEALGEEGNRMEKTSHSMQLFFGNQENALNAIDFAQKKVMEGKGAWDYGDVMQGFKAIGEVGLDATKNYDLIANMAGKAGTSFSEASEAIKSAIQGNTAAFESYGIEEIYLRHLKGIKENTPEMKAAVMGFLKQQKQFEGGAEEFANTLEGYKVRMKAYGTSIKQAIMGRPNDPNSLMGMVKGTYGKVVNWLEKNQAKIKHMAESVALVFKYLWQKVDNFVGRIIKKVDLMNPEKFREKVMRFILWLELTKNKVMRFFENWGGAIKTFAKILGGVWLFGKVAPMVTNMLSIAKALGGIVKLAPGLGAVASAITVIMGAKSMMKGFESDESAAALARKASMEESGRTGGLSKLANAAGNRLFGRKQNVKAFEEFSTNVASRSGKQLDLETLKKLADPTSALAIETEKNLFDPTNQIPRQVNLGGVTLQFNMNNDPLRDQVSAAEFAEKVKQEIERLTRLEANRG